MRVLRPVGLHQWQGARVSRALGKPEEYGRAPVRRLFRRHPGQRLDKDREASPVIERVAARGTFPGQGLGGSRFALLPAGLRHGIEQQGTEPKLAAGLAFLQALAAEFDYAVKVAACERDMSEEVQRCQLKLRQLHHSRRPSLRGRAAGPKAYAPASTPSKITVRSPARSSGVLHIGGPGECGNEPGT